MLHFYKRNVRARSRTTAQQQTTKRISLVIVCELQATANFCGVNSRLAHTKVHKLFLSFSCVIVTKETSKKYGNRVSSILASIRIVNSIPHLHRHHWVLAPHRWLFYISCFSFFRVTFIVLRVLGLSRPNHKVLSNARKFLRSPAVVASRSRPLIKTQPNS